jgi:hypothetical protein
MNTFYQWCCEMKEWTDCNETVDSGIKGTINFIYEYQLNDINDQM